VRFIGSFIAVCVLMLGLLAWYLFGAPSHAGDGEPVAMRGPAAHHETDVANAASQPGSPMLDRANSAAEATADVPTARPTVSWPIDPDLQDAWRRVERAQQTLREEPSHEGALRDMAAALADLRQWLPLATTLSRLVELCPDDTALRFEHATVLMQLRQWIDAIVELKALVAQQPDHTKAWFNLAAAHQAVGHLAEARQAWDRVIELSPSPEAWARRGEVLLDLHAWEPAAADFEAVLARQPGAADATLNLALALGKLGRHSEARTRLLALLQQQPRHIPALNRMAELALAECRDGGTGSRAACNEAAEWCRRSLSLDPQQPDVQGWLAVAEEGQR
jgi:tetratricopeptide (TPR) repeat protein